MPWTAKQFKDRHNRSLTDKQSETAARIANGLIKKGYTDSEAVRLTNGIMAKNKKIRKQKRRNE